MPPASDDGDRSPAHSRPAAADGPPLRRALIALCITEITSWGVLYYAFPVMLSSVARDTGWSTTTSMTAFSTGAVVNALAGVPVGRLIDRHGPRAVMTTGSVLGVAAVLAIAAAPTLPLLFAAWILTGLAQSAVLYQPAFAAITVWYGAGRVRALTTLTLVAGFASTVFAPLTAALLAHLTWRGAYLVLAAVLAMVTIPLHAICLTPPWTAGVTRREPDSRRRDDRARSIVRSGAFIALSVAMTFGAFGLYSATINLVPLLVSYGMSTPLAAFGLGMCGVGQVLGRLGYPLLVTRIKPRTRPAVILTVGTAAVAALGLAPRVGALLIGIAVLAGSARGLFTLVQATAVADRWGNRSFGRINGVFSAPITIAIALAPGGGALLTRLTAGYAASYTLLAGITFAGAVAVTAFRPRPSPAPLT
jgi:MFS family permease